MMRLLIDGYNLLHVTGIIGDGGGPATLERSRHALLNFLAATLELAERAQTTVVFDAKNAPPGLPRTLIHDGLSVIFAPRSEEADTVIEQLIHEHSAPRQLTVVSSDHRIQRAARRRRATAVDSDRWYAGQLRQRRKRAGKGGQPQEEKPPAPLSDAEVKWWLAQFTDIEFGELLSEQQPTLPRPSQRGSSWSEEDSETN